MRILFAALVAAVCLQANLPEIPRFRQVNSHIYRGGQPGVEAWPVLRQLGVKTVIDLRSSGDRSEAERRAVEAAGMRYVNVPLSGWLAPSEPDIAKVLSHLASGEPVFVHCRHGKDRTGMVIAAYRIAYQGWDAERALDEAEDIGMHWVHFNMKSFVKRYTRRSALATA